MPTMRQSLARPQRERPEPTNIHMPRTRKVALAHRAVTMYGKSMTWLMNELAQKEIDHKRGVINAKLK